MLAGTVDSIGNTVMPAIIGTTILMPKIEV